MQQQGTLVVRVYTTRAQLPVEGATVVVTRVEGDGMPELLSVQTTDSSGLSRPIRVESPGAGESIRPGGTDPFAVCTVWAERPGYAMLRADGVQIFPGVETVQEMELIPLAEGQDSLLRHQDRRATAQNL